MSMTQTATPMLVTDVVDGFFGWEVSVSGFQIKEP